MVEKSISIEKAHFESIGKAAKAGVKLAMGTDSGTAMNNFNENSSFELEVNGSGRSYTVTSSPISN